MTRLFGVFAAAILLQSCGESGPIFDRENLLIVGSSTVFPFTKAVADRFAAALIHSPNGKVPNLTSQQLYEALVPNAAGIS